MELSIKKKIGRETHTFLVSGKNLYELVMESQKLSFGNIEQCGICGSDLLFLNARLAQNKYKYVEIKCAKCKGSLTFGNKQDNPDIYYLRREENKDGEKVYAWKAYNSENVDE